MAKILTNVQHKPGRNGAGHYRFTYRQSNGSKSVSVQPYNDSASRDAILRHAEFELEPQLKKPAG